MLGNVGERLTRCSRRNAFNCNRTNRIFGEFSECLITFGLMLQTPDSRLSRFMILCKRCYAVVILRLHRLTYRHYDIESISIRFRGDMPCAV